MELIKGVTTLTERLECGIDIPEPQMEAPREESLFFELYGTGYRRIFRTRHQRGEGSLYSSLQRGAVNYGLQ